MNTEHRYGWRILGGAAVHLKTASADDRFYAHFTIDYDRRIALEQGFYVDNKTGQKFMFDSKEEGQVWDIDDPAARTYFARFAYITLEEFLLVWMR